MRARVALVVGIAVLVAEPALAAFGCFEWPSTLDPAADVQYIVSGDCTADVAALGAALRLNLSAVQCTNAAGMIAFGEWDGGCDQVLDSLRQHGSKGVALAAACDGGYLAVNSSDECAPLSDTLTRMISEGTPATNTTTTTPESHTRAPADGIREDNDSDRGKKLQPLIDYFQGRGAKWYAAFGGCAAAALVALALVGMALRKGVRKLRSPRAGPFYPARKRVKQGVYSGEDELGFSTEIIKELGPKAPAATSSTPKKTVTRRPSAGEVRYHHHDWCASSEQEQQPLVGHSQRVRLSNSSMGGASGFGIDPVPGWESDTDHSLLLY